MSVMAAKEAVTNGEDALSPRLRAEMEGKRAKREEASNAKRDLFGTDFDGDWQSSDGQPLRLTETDGVFEVNGVRADGFLNPKSMIVTYRRKNGVYSLHVYPNGTVVLFVLAARCHTGRPPPTCTAQPSTFGHPGGMRHADERLQSYGPIG
jgi:hypothetical protein